MRQVGQTRLSPAQIVLLSFLGVITVGTALLSLPAATASGERMSFVNALFTATSGTCVTGLAVVDTATQLSRFGQIVVLTCVQIGGLGLMAFTTMFIVLAERRLGIADAVVLQESFHTKATHNVGKLLKYIVASTFIAEALGAAALALHWTVNGRFESFWETLYHAVFHSVSAFCNAGFAVLPTASPAFQNDTTALLILSLLIVTGGVGFLVAFEIGQRTRYAVVRWVARRRGMIAVSTHGVKRLSLHSKFVLISTAALLAIGTVSYYFLERRGVYAHLSFLDAWVNSWFASVTARTAGFNTVDYAQMSGAALLCTMTLMFIGASPGSTGGGIKTSTFALLVAYSYSRWRGHGNLRAFGRTVPAESRERAGTVVVVGIAVVLLAASGLMALETYHLHPARSQDLFLPMLFETISAFGTVGLSLGQTPLLGTPGKLVVCVVMLLGRIGPITVALAVSRREQRERFRYAEENIMVG